MDSNPLVSVIVPTKNSGVFLEKCLASIKSQTYSNIELIVVDNFSTDDTSKIARRFTKDVYEHGPERSAQRNYGVAHSHGEYIAIIDSDMELSAAVIEECVRTAKEHAGIVGLVIPEESFGEGFWAQCKKLERSFYIGVPWMEAARFFRKEIYDQLGGYDEKNTGTEDYDLPQRMKAKYGEHSIGRISSFIYHNEQKISLVKTCKKKYYYAQNLGVYREKSENKKVFKKQSSPIERYRLFLAHPKKLFRRPLVGCGMLFMKTCELGSGGMGYVVNR